MSSPGSIGSPLICGFNTNQHSKWVKQLNKDIGYTILRIKRIQNTKFYSQRYLFC